MNIDENKALQAVNVINAAIYDALGDNDADLLAFGCASYSSDGAEEYIEFLGFPLWSSANDEREWVKSEDGEEDLEPLLPFLVKGMRKIVVQLGPLAKLEPKL